MTKHTDNTAAELLPCPFCKKSLKHEGSFYLHPETECVMQHTVFHQDSETAKLWNARQQDARLEREAVAKEVYEAMRWAIMRAPYHDESPPKWTEGGNSLVQDRARQAADSVLALRTQQPAAQPTDHAGEKGTATIAAQQPETDPVASPALVMPAPPYCGGTYRMDVSFYPAREFLGFKIVEDATVPPGEIHAKCPAQPHKAEVERLNEKQRNMIGAHLDGVYLFSARENCDTLLSEIFKATLPPTDMSKALEWVKGQIEGDFMLDGVWVDNPSLLIRSCHEEAVKALARYKAKAKGAA